MEYWKILILTMKEVSKKRKITIANLARKRNIHHSSMRNFFLTKNPPTLANVVKVCELLGLRLTIENVSGVPVDLKYLEELAKLQLNNITMSHSNKITPNTILVVKKDWITPYNSFHKGNTAKAEYWASKLGKSTNDFITDFNGEYLSEWLEVYE